MTPRIKNFSALGDMDRYCIAGLATGEGMVRMANLDTYSLIGVTTDVGAPAGGRIDVILSGPAKVEYGADLVYGEHFMASATGRAIPVTAGKKALGRVWGTGGAGAVCDCEIYGEHL